jgi:hypothetical protein
MKAIETTGRIEKSGHLKLDKPLDVIAKNQKVKVIILYDETDDIGEMEWLSAIANNPAFEFLKDEGENIYSIRDGKPIKK